MLLPLAGAVHMVDEAREYRFIRTNEMVCSTSIREMSYIIQHLLGTKKCVISDHCCCSPSGAFKVALVCWNLPVPPPSRPQNFMPVSWIPTYYLQNSSTRREATAISGTSMNTEIGYHGLEFTSYIEALTRRELCAIAWPHVVQSDNVECDIWVTKW